MSKIEKYRTDDPDFDKEFGVMKNRLGIKNPLELEMRESQALMEAYDYAALNYEDSHVFSIDDIKKLHHLFLGKIYDWAGEYRSVDLSSPGIRWCRAAYIESEMQKFQQSLQEMTPFTPDMTFEDIIQKFSYLHGELIVIHPFRDGNGRVARLLGNLLLLQSGRSPLLQHSFYDESWQREYFEGIQKVWQKANYTKLMAFFAKCVG